MFVRKLMKINLIANVAILAPLLLVMILPASISLAQGNGNNNGGGNGGGGGGGSSAYSIVPFNPPGIESVSSYVGDMNDMGQAAGGFERADGTSQAVHLDLDTGDYTFLAGGSDSGAGDVNNLNQIVGNSDGIGAFWSDPEAVAPVALPPLDGQFRSFANRVNDTGIVIGGSDPVSEYWTPVIWRVVVDGNGVASKFGPLELPPVPGGFDSWGSEITETVGGIALVVGWSFDGTSQQAVVWTIELGANGTLVTPDPPVLLGTLGLRNPSFSSASSVNNFGEISGSSDRRPFIAPLGEGPEELPVPRNTLDANALDINDSGECVGRVQIQFRGSNILDGPRYAYLWKDGEAIDLFKQIPKGSGWEYLTYAGSINNAGLIAGHGRFDVSRRGFILIPNSP